VTKTKNIIAETQRPQRRKIRQKDEGKNIFHDFAINDFASPSSFYPDFLAFFPSG
jgi:hypothetical protein